MNVPGALAELEAVLKVTYYDGVNPQMAEENMFLKKLEAYGQKKSVAG